MADLTPECSCRPMERWNYCASRCPVTFAREQKKMRGRQSIASLPSPPLSQLGFDDGNEISGRTLESEISACTFYDINRRVDVENGHFRTDIVSACSVYYVVSCSERSEMASGWVDSWTNRHQKKRDKNKFLFRHWYEFSLREEDDLVCELFSLGHIPPLESANRITMYNITLILAERCLLSWVTRAFTFD